MMNNLKQGWERKRLGEVLEKNLTLKINNNETKIIKYVDISSVSNLTYKIETFEEVLASNAPSRARKIINTNDVIFALVRPTLKRIALVPHILNGEVASTGFMVLKSKNRINPSYLFYFLTSEEFINLIKPLERGTSYPAITESDMNSQFISLPPLAEQQAIVEKLDAAFVAFSRLEAIYKDNKKNAKALFENELNRIFTQKGEGWQEKKLGEVCILQRGYDLPVQNRKHGKFPLVSSNGITDCHNVAMAKAMGITTGRSGTMGKVFFIEEDFFPLNTVLFVKEFFGNEPKYVFFLLKFMKLEKYASGSSVPTLNRNIVHEQKIFHNFIIPEQILIAAHLDALQAKTKRLEAFYDDKLRHLKSLKEAMLARAFRGDLT
jgi:type I restriction enzyme, S subunit